MAGPSCSAPVAATRLRYACQEARRGSAWPRRSLAAPSRAAGPRGAATACGRSAAELAAGAQGGGAASSARAVHWPEMPNPLQAVGRASLEAWAGHLTRVLGGQGVSGFTAELCRVIRLLVEGQLGPGAGAACARVEPLVWRLAAGQVYDVHEAGKGRQFAVSYLEGLSPNRPFHSVEEHPWCEELAAHAETIIRELQEGNHAELWTAAGKETCRKMSAPDWKILSLVSYGTWIAGAAFPKTKEVLESIRGWRSNEVLLGRMPPHTHIGEHSDNMNFVLTAHLGLQLEQGPKCTLTVGDWTRQWARGQVLVFDTSYIHSCANDSDKDRYVLICRFWHPGCSEEERFALTILQAMMACVKRQEGAGQLFQASHETHGPAAVRPLQST